MAYKVIILYRLYMPSYFLGTFTEYPFDKAHLPEMLPVASYTRAAFSGQSFARPVWTGSRLSH